MKSTALFLGLALAALTAPALAATAVYQVTGPLVEADANHLVVMKGKEKWELNRTASTQVTGDLKPGDKVTIKYTMAATSVEDKTAAKPAAKPMVKPTTKPAN